MLKFLGISLIFLAFIMILPVSNSNTQSDLPKMYGIATVLLKDSTGNILFENVIHNQVVDTGTGYMLDQTFGDGTAVLSDANQVDTMCVTDFATPDGATNDAETAADFNAENGLNISNNCIGAISFTTASTTAGSGTRTFSAATHFPAGTVVGGIGICGDNGTASPFNNCSEAAGDAPLLAVVDTTNVTVNAGESVDITYTLTLD
ncbi:MAG: hypothetical protein ACRD90_03450 [Nitrosopumilaceae archaeon]